MKKMTAIILTLAMAVTLSACGKEEAPARNGGNSNSSASQSSKVSDKAYVLDGIDGTYTGNWENGMPEGNGKFTSVNNNYFYNGEWVNGLPHGKGEFYSETESEKLYYNGDFFNGHFQGTGYLEEHFDGITGSYKGEFSQDEPNGSGIICYDLGSTSLILEGEFLNGSEYGRLTYNEYDTSGKLIDSGIYENGELISDTDIKINNAIYDFGEYLADKNGVGDLYDSIAPYIYDRDSY